MASINITILYNKWKGPVLVARSWTIENWKKRETETDRENTHIEKEITDAPLITVLIDPQERGQHMYS